MGLFMCNVCIHCQRVLVDYEGWCELLDIDNIICHANGEPAPRPVTDCVDCPEAEWDFSDEDAELDRYRMLSSWLTEGEWEDEEVREHYESDNGGEYLTDMLEMLIQSGIDWDEE
jgi:hypothetical protein